MISDPAVVNESAPSGEIHDSTIAPSGEIHDSTIAPSGEIQLVDYETYDNELETIRAREHAQDIHRQIADDRELNHNLQEQHANNQTPVIAVQELPPRISRTDFIPQDAIIFKTIDDAVAAGATRVIINKRGTIFTYTPEQWRRLEQKQRDQLRLHQESRPPHPLPPTTLAPQEEIRMLRGLVREANRDRDNYYATARKYESENTELRRQRDHWHKQAERWQRTNSANVDGIEALKKEKEEYKSKYYHEREECDKFRSELIEFRKFINKHVE